MATSASARTLRRPIGPRFPGSFITYMRQPLRFLIEGYRRYGEVVRWQNLYVPVVSLYGAAANRLILVDQVDNFLVSPLMDRVGARFIGGQGLLFIDNPMHNPQRRLIQPAMHRARLDTYQEIIRQVATQMLDRWAIGQPVNILRELNEMAVIVEGRTLFGMDFSGSARELSRAVDVVSLTVGNVMRLALARLPFDIPSLGYGASVRQALTLLHTTLDDLIARHEREGTDTGDVVSMLVAARAEDGGRLSLTQVRDHLLTLFMAGHETVPNTVAWACYLLAQHPAVTTRLLAELETQLHGAPPTLNDLERLPYLEQVVKETLRLYPPAVTLFRVVRDPLEWQGYMLGAGQVVTYSPFVSHRIPAAFPDPETFRPERFDPAGNPPPSYAYIPFGGGPRSCIGAPFALLEIRLVLAMILQRFRLDLVPDQRIELVLNPALQPKYGLHMRPVPQDGHPERSAAHVLGDVVGATPGPW